MEKKKKNSGVDLVRFFRKSHTYIGLVLAPLLILIAGTGIILNHTAEFGQHPLNARIHAGLVTGAWLIDIGGAVLIYLSATGIYMWAYNRAKKKSSASDTLTKTNATASKTTA